MEYLDFELTIKELEDQLQKCYEIGEESAIDVVVTCKKIESKLEKKKKELYKSLSPWQRVQLSRHPNRPYTLDYIKAICGDTFMELHGDRSVKDDKAMIGGLGKNWKPILYVYRSAKRIQYQNPTVQKFRNGKSRRV